MFDNYISGLGTRRRCESAQPGTDSHRRVQLLHGKDEAPAQKALGRSIEPGPRAPSWVASSRVVYESDLISGTGVSLPSD